MFDLHSMLEKKECSAFQNIKSVIKRQSLGEVCTYTVHLSESFIFTTPSIACNQRIPTIRLIMWLFI